MKNEKPHRSYIATVLSCRCPRCREGNMFAFPISWRMKRNMQMNDSCPVCRQPTDIEVGFYYGTSYVSYVIGILFSVVSFIIWLLTIGVSFSDHRFLIWVILNSTILVVMQPWLMRFSRALWLSWFVKFDPDWDQHAPEPLERVNREQMNNW